MTGELLPWAPLEGREEYELKKRSKTANSPLPIPTFPVFIILPIWGGRASDAMGYLAGTAGPKHPFLLPILSFPHIWVGL